MSESSQHRIRRHDVDWLRVILFGLLIWFHYAVFSLDQLEDGKGGMEVFNLPLFFIISVMHQWRLAALFLISGMGTAFAFRRRSWQMYVSERGTRLGIPLLFGTYILWMGILSPIDTTQRLLSIFPGSESMPYGHLWFIYNLLIYSLLLTPLFVHIKKTPDGKVIRLVRSLLRIRYGLGILFVPPLILAVNGILFKPWEFGEVGMWWEFPRYLLYFLFGYLLISAKDDYFSVIDRVRVPVSILTPILAITWFIVNESSDIPAIMEGGWVHRGYAAFSLDVAFASLLQSFHAWFWCLFIFSWASKLLNKPNKWLSYLNEAVYPTYIVHMHLTFLPIAIFGIFGAGYYAGLTLGTILVMVGVMMCFEIIRRASLSRIFFGVKGGHQETMKLYPYTLVKGRDRKIVLSFFFHGLVLGMILMLIAMLIAAGIIGGR